MSGCLETHRRLKGGRGVVRSGLVLHFKDMRVHVGGERVDLTERTFRVRTDVKISLDVGRLHCAEVKGVSRVTLAAGAAPDTAEFLDGLAAGVRWVCAGERRPLDPTKVVPERHGPVLLCCG